MELISPLEAIDLPGVEGLQLEGLIVVIGPNSSGKSQLLKDLNEVICGRPRDLVVATRTRFRSQYPFDNYFEAILERDALRQDLIEPDLFHKRGLQFGADVGFTGELRKTRVERHFITFTEEILHETVSTPTSNDFLRELGPIFCSPLFLKNRLSLMDASPNFDHLNGAPTMTLQSLSMSPNAKKALANEIARVFRRGVWVDGTPHPNLVIRVSDGTDIPNSDDRLEPSIMDGYRTIEEEGDGLRSYAAICSTILLGQRPLCLIDEPEMCLHPPQAEGIGRFIGSNVADETCTVVATHSSYVLRGILEARPDTKIIRLTRAVGRFRANVLASDALSQATSKPRSRSEVILDGLMSHSVVLCEGEGDRLVYESSYRTFEEQHLDIRFISSEGTGGFADPLRLYKALEIPAAVMTDFDFLDKEGELRKVLDALGVTPSVTKKMGARIKQAIKEIKSVILPDDMGFVRDELAAINNIEIDSNAMDMSKLRSQISKILDKANNLGDMKRNGVKAVPDRAASFDKEINLQAEIKEIIGELREFGLFIVPIGELESWLSKYMKRHDKKDKSQWAVSAAEMIENIGYRDEDVWQFVHSVHDFLENRLAEAIQPP